MKSDDAGLRSFASTYLNMVLQRNYRTDLDAYDQWYATTQGLDAETVLANEIQQSVEAARDPDTRNVRGLLQQLNQQKPMIMVNPQVRDALLKSGFDDLLNQWKQAGYIDTDHEAFQWLSQLKRTRPKPGSARYDRTELDERSSNQAWTEYLTSLPADASWYVGARAGSTMSRLEGDRAWDILSNSWDQISPDVRCQILKGFTPGFGIKRLNSRYLDILALGYRSKEPRVHQFAESYLESVVLRKFANADEFRNELLGIGYMFKDFRTNDLRKSTIFNRKWI